MLVLDDNENALLVAGLQSPVIRFQRCRANVDRLTGTVVFSLVNRIAVCRRPVTDDWGQGHLQSP